MIDNCAHRTSSLWLAAAFALAGVSFSGYATADESPPIPATSTASDTSTSAVTRATARGEVDVSELVPEDANEERERLQIRANQNSQVGINCQHYPARCRTQRANAQH